MHSKIYDVIILGAGASGLMAGANLPKGLSVLVIDANASFGKKIAISGGGKCNITNANISEDNFLGKSEFVKKVLQGYTYRDILNYFKHIAFIKRDDGKYFTKNGAKQIVDFFRTHTKHCHIELNQKCESVTKKDDLFICKCQNGIFKSRHFVVASGGMSFANLGASSIGYEIATHFGHEITPTQPALVGLSLQKDEWWMKSLSGISLKVKIYVDDKIIEDELLFSHRGISGPAVLNLSLYWTKKRVRVNFLPKKDLKSYLDMSSKKQISSSLPLAKRFIKSFLQHIELEDKSICKLSKSDMQKLSLIHSYEFAPAGNFGYSKAEVTKGGVKTDMIDADSMESERIKNLYFLGEVLDVTGELGGYNLHFALISALKFVSCIKINHNNSII